MQSALRGNLPINVPGLSSYPDFLAFTITFGLTSECHTQCSQLIFLLVMLLLGVQESTRFNSVFTCLNLLVVLFVVIAGSFHVDFHNWNLAKSEINTTLAPNEVGGEGGFLPFGFSGMMSGAATCFYGKQFEQHTEDIFESIPSLHWLRCDRHHRGGGIEPAEIDSNLDSTLTSVRIPRLLRSVGSTDTDDAVLLANHRTDQGRTIALCVRVCWLASGQVDHLGGSTDRPVHLSAWRNVSPAQGTLLDGQRWSDLSFSRQCQSPNTDTDYCHLDFGHICRRNGCIVRCEGIGRHDVHRFGFTVSLTDLTLDFQELCSLTHWWPSRFSFFATVILPG